MPIEMPLTLVPLRSLQNRRRIHFPSGPEFLIHSGDSGSHIESSAFFNEKAVTR